MSSAFQRYVEQDEKALFGNLRLLSASLSRRAASGAAAGIDPDDFDFLSDNMFIVRASERFGAFRFEYCGPAWSRMTRTSDLLHVPFAELSRDVRARRDLAGYAHVARTKLAHVSRNHEFLGGKTAFFTRLLLPQIRQGRVISIIGTTVFHDVPVGADLVPLAPPTVNERIAASC